jgi:hypothetical protein
MPKERVAKSAIVVPVVVEATITAQYNGECSFLAAIWIVTSSNKTVKKMALLAR